MAKKKGYKARTFILSSKDAFRKAEKFKFMLENQGYKVDVRTFGVDRVRIQGKLKRLG
ncbi:MAG: hypothetical protein AM325_016450 [Candidatus Thorarchaeota archaeon SMTZ1-45]